MVLTHKGNIASVEFIPLWFKVLASATLISLLFRSLIPQFMPFILVSLTIGVGLINFRIDKKYKLTITCTILFLLFLIGLINTIFISSTGFFYYSFIYLTPLLFWFTLYSFGVGNLIEKVFFYIGVIMVFGSIAQYHFIDPSLIGGYSLYQDGYDPELSPYTLRSTSFIGSPQMLGFFCAIFAFFSISREYSLGFIPLIPIIIYAGLLSGSTAFGIAAGMLFFSLPFIDWQRYKSFYIYLLPLLVILISYFLYEFLTSEEDVALLNALRLGLDSHIPYYQAMLEKINFSLIGEGFGSANRLSEVSNITLDYGYQFIPMVESSVLSIFHEQGIVGTIFFGIMIISSIVCSILYQEKSISRSHTVLVIYLILNAMATPVITGYTGLILTYFILLNPLKDFYKYHQKLL